LIILIRQEPVVRGDCEKKSLIYRTTAPPPRVIPVVFRLPAEQLSSPLYPAKRSAKNTFLSQRLHLKDNRPGCRFPSPASASSPCKKPSAFRP